MKNTICRRNLVSGLFVIALVSICACTGGSGGSSPGAVDDPPGPSAAEELETYLKDQYATSVFEDDAYNLRSWAVDDGFAEVAADAAPSAKGSGATYSQTNIQEQGVDESDQVKTDGVYMYVAHQRQVRIVNAVPADGMGLVGTVDVNGLVQELYLFGDILVIIHTPDGDESTSWTGTDLVGKVGVGMPYWIPVKAQVGVMMVDVSNPSVPDRITEVKADGSFVSSRLTGGKLHIIQQFLPDLPPLELHYTGAEVDRDAAIDANRQALEPLVLDDMIPGYEIVDQDGNVLDNGRLVAAEDFYQPVSPEGGSTVTIVTFDMSHPGQPFQSTGLIADAHLVYASTESIYTVATHWDSLAKTDGEFNQSQQSVIHRFDLSGTKVTHLGNGQIQGRILNQFSLGEYEYGGKAVLRIATTTGDSWWSGLPSSNHVYCLQEAGGNLEVIGKIEGLAPGETLYAARFIGDRGFLVTFVRVDPLFTLDLSDPTDPTVMGELKVPGYSDYIHPLGENHLLTIGKDTLEVDGFTLIQGVQLSVFDITDFAKPTLLYKEIIGGRGTGSEASYNHKAFTFWTEENLLAIPIQLYEGASGDVWDWGKYTFDGLYVYRVTADSGFESLGRISTRLGSEYDYGWTRGIFIDDSVYAVKSDRIRSADVSDIENTVNTLEFVD